MKNRAVFFGALLLAVAFPAFADAPKADKPDAQMQKPVTVPLEILKTKHLAIQVKINGKGPYRMIFDTGAPLNLISSKVAKESGMLGKDAKGPVLPIFGAMGQHPIGSLEVGALKAEKIPAMVMDHPAVAALSRALGPIEGIIGYSFFARYTMTIDYENKQLTLTPNGYQPTDILETLTAMILNKNLEPIVLAPTAQWGLLVSKEATDEEAGVVINQVRPGSAADSAGLKAGDRLLSIDGRWTESVLDCFMATGSIKPGSETPVVIRRDGKEMKLTVRPRAGL